MWDVLTDVQRVASWVTVVGEVEEIEHLARYRTVLADRLGPFKLAADLAVAVTDLDEPNRITLRADGEDRQVASRIQIDASMSLASDGASTTVDVTGRYEVTGRVATLGASMIKTKGEKILDEFFAAVGDAFS